jgi:exosortase
MTPATAPISPLSAPGRAVVAFAAVLTGALCVFLWPEWAHNPDLSHGLFVPVLFPLLIMESRRRGPWCYPRDTPVLAGCRFACLAAGLALLVIAGLYAAAVEWTHPLVAFSLSLALSGLLLGALLWLSTDRVRAVPLNWSSLVAVGLWPLCSPLPPGMYSGLTLKLQFLVTRFVLECLHLLGIAASTSGNIIQLAHTSVGVEEACSGVRSLLSCVVAAVFFSATMVRRPWARVFLILLAPPLAFGMNILRSLALTLLANAGVDIGGSWHDLTGFAVLGVTAVILGGIAVLLETAPASSPPSASPEGGPRPRPWGLLAGCGLAAGLVLFFGLKTGGPALAPRPVPDLQAILPPEPSGWDLVQTQNLYQFAPILQTEHLVERSYVREASPEHPAPLLINVYLAYWPPGKVRVSVVASHTPDACWPGSGWEARPSPPPPSPFLVGRRALPQPQYRTFTNGGSLQHVWYWHLYDGTSISQINPFSAADFVKLGWNYGFRSAGEQLFVRISSNLPWNEIKDDPLMAEVFAGLAPHGL